MALRQPDLPDPPSAAGTASGPSCWTSTTGCGIPPTGASGPTWRPRDRTATRWPNSSRRARCGSPTRWPVAIGLGQLKGTSEPFLCHTLCELGAEPLERELKAMASFLKQQPGAGADRGGGGLRAAVDGRTGLRRGRSDALRRDAAARRGSSRRWGKLVDSDHRLLVFAEEKGGSPSWYMPAFDYIQDTPSGRCIPPSSAAPAIAARRQSAAADQPLDTPVSAEPDPQRPDRASRLPARAHRAMHARAWHPGGDPGGRLLPAHGRGRGRQGAQRRGLSGPPVGGCSRSSSPSSAGRCPSRPWKTGRRWGVGSAAGVSSGGSRLWRGGPHPGRRCRGSRRWRSRG